MPVDRKSPPDAVVLTMAQRGRNRFGAGGGRTIVIRRRIAARKVRASALALLVVVSLAASCARLPRPEDIRAGAPPVAVRTDRSCDQPVDGAFDTASPEQVALDSAAIRRAMATEVAGQLSLRVYRHNCLIASSRLDRWTASQPNEIWSATKAVVALVVGRAEAMGLLDIDDPIGPYLTRGGYEVRDEVAAITIRQLLNQTSGLRFHWVNDIDASLGDSVRWTLSLPLDHEPGTVWQYGQTTVTTLLAVVGLAAGEDPVAFARRELFDPLGIRRVIWTRDGAGHPLGFAGLKLSPDALARLGTLVLDEGVWNGSELLSGDFIAQMPQPGADNGGYGFLWWTNVGDSYQTTPVFTSQHRSTPWLPTFPRDTFGMSGAFEQFVAVIPSLDMVVVRTGLTADGAEAWRYRLGVELMAGVLDLPQPAPPAFVKGRDVETLESLIDFCSLPQLDPPAWLCVG